MEPGDFHDNDLYIWNTETIIIYHFLTIIFLYKFDKTIRFTFKIHNIFPDPLLHLEKLWKSDTELYRYNILSFSYITFFAKKLPLIKFHIIISE